MKDSKVYLPHNIVDFAVFLVALAFFALRNIPIVLYGSQIFLLMSLTIFQKNTRININYFISWILIVIWTIVSLLWAKYDVYAYKFLREILQVAVISIIFSMYCSSKDNIKKVIGYIAISCAIMCIYIVCVTPRNEWINIYYSTNDISSDEGRLGYSIGIHPNSFGGICVISIVLWTYILLKDKKYISILWIFFSLFLLFFSKSRSALIELLLCFTFIGLLRTNNKKVFVRICVLVFLVFLLNYLIFHVQFLYELIGFRFSGLSHFFENDSSKVDASVRGRLSLIKAGIEIIKNHTLVGVGAGNYAPVAYNDYSIWRAVYSHCNYIEIFADLGLVGFLLYYVPRFMCISYLVRKARQIKSFDIVVVVSIVLSSLISEISVITYSSETIQILYTLAFCYYIILKKEGKMNEK